jgi:hypothetical protein
MLKFSGVKHLRVIIRTFQPSSVKSVSDKHVMTPDEKHVRTKRRKSHKYDRSFLCFDTDTDTDTYVLVFLLQNKGLR